MDRHRTHIKCDNPLCDHIIGIFNAEKTHVYIFDFRQGLMEYTGSAPAVTGVNSLLFNRVTNLNSSTNPTVRVQTGLTGTLDQPMTDLFNYYSSISTNALAAELESYDPFLDSVVPTDGDSTNDFINQLFDRALPDSDSMDTSLYSD